MRKHLPLLVSLLVAVTACTPQTPTAAGVAGQSGSATVKATGVITGSVLAPSRLIGSIVPTGAGNVIPTGAGNLVPLANTEVYLADAAGQPYPSLEPVTTDANGQFTFPDVPAGYTFMVVAEARDTKLNKDVTLQTLVKSSELGATATVDVASSFVTAAVTEGQGSALGEFNVASFRTATEATARGLTEDDIDRLGDRSALLARIDELAASIAELQQALAAIREDLKEIKNSLDEIKDRLDNQPPPPPAGQTPPPGGQMPPPGGQAAGPGNNPGNCLAPTSARFSLVGTYSGYPLRVELISSLGHVIATVTFTAAGTTSTVTVPTGCPLSAKLKDASGKVLATSDNFIVPHQATEVILPF